MRGEDRKSRQRRGKDYYILHGTSGVSVDLSSEFMVTILHLMTRELNVSCTSDSQKTDYSVSQGRAVKKRSDS
ncbi:hypothetical protein JOQ06_025481 [Pogonophryne albipinna]|uniref:Uncharacterized protein n=1 Tax=Pogonophryne albipinna TaxID=1090488 RepID=A0AAD6ASJ8_9TELE|nr:hypothetical protein JOQ06_025481 [Pogonophryne albipinna]